ncbi:class E sortase [Brevibacterium luteolum]|nr:class E sortase [Brevibacterium luteolum]
MDQPMSRRERIAQERAAAARQTGNGAGDSGTAAASGTAGAPTSGAAPTGPRPVIKSASRHSEHSYGTPSVASAQAYGATAPQTEPMPRATRHADFDTVVFGDEPPRARTARKPKPEREPLGPVRGTIRAFGELCITAGLILILFVVWQLWWTDIAANEDNRNLANELTTQWQDNPRNELPEDPDTPYVSDPADLNSAFGIMYIPRFGEDYYRTIAEGVSLEPVLNRMGLGRYPNAAMPGEVGNFAMAGHRVTYGKPLNLIAEIRPGDEAIVQTADGYYTYTFVNFDIVLPDQTEVLAPVPDMPDYKGKDRIMTLTACNPMFSARERYIGYFELTDWRHASEGPPDSIKDSSAYKKAGATD